MSDVIELNLKHGTCLYDADAAWAVEQFRWRSFVTGRANTPYAQAAIPVRWRGSFKGCLRMHRFVFEADCDRDVDHINGNGLDNRKANLRYTDASMNKAASRMNKNNTSGYRGVYWDKHVGKWCARIGIHNKRVFLGYAATQEECAHIYDAAAARWFGPFASLNFGKNEAGLEMRRSAQ